MISDFWNQLQGAEVLEDANTLFMNLFNDIFEHFQEIKKTKYDDLVASIINLIENNYRKNTLSINYIADEVNMSSAYLGKLFKQLTAKSITDYICEVRLSKAKELLKNTETSINEISELTGFTNSSYFYMVFKKEYGITPNQFRQQS